MENLSTSTNSSFENGIRWWSLEFADQAIEREYKEERISLKRVPHQVRIFFIIAALTNATLLILDSLSAFVFTTDYHYQLTDMLILPLYLPIFGFEFLFYKWKFVTFMRGSFFTCFIYFIVFYGSTLRYAESVDYPVISPNVLLWHGSMFFVHIFYVRSWIYSLATYAIVYIEIICIIFTIYGARFFKTTISSGIIDTLYYVVLFAAFIGFSVYAFRTFELKERASFFCEHKARSEMEEWKTLLNDLPEPVILAQAGEITFSNSATRRFLNLPLNSNEIAILAELEKVKPTIGGERKLTDIIKAPISLPATSTLPQINTDTALENNDFTINNGCEKIFKYEGIYGKKHKIQLKHVAIRPTVGFPIMEYIFHDITAVEELEREKTQRHCFRLLVATASHDIRTPLNAIQGVLEILSEKTKDYSSLNELSIAKTAVKKMELYIRGLACLQNIEVGALDIEPTCFNVKNTVKEICEYFEQTIQSKGIQLEIQDDTKNTIKTDKQKYEIILYHILENAVKYTIEGKIVIKLIYNYEQNQFETYVSDTGLGMTPDQISQLFKLFGKKPDSSNSLCPQGIGLGLFLAGSLIECLGGKINIDSNIGMGTKVCFSVKVDENENLPEIESEPEILDEKYIPRPIPNNNIPFGACRSLTSIIKEKIHSPSEQATCLTSRDLLSISRKFSIQIPCSCPKILIVDDEPFNLMILERFLSKTGLQCDQAFNGKSALELIQKRVRECQICNGYKVIFLDINMPLMNGIQAMQKISELIKNKEIPRVPVFAITAAAQTEEKSVIEQYQNYGFSQICIFLGVEKNYSKKTSE